jgi:predicted kinase
MTLNGERPGLVGLDGLDEAQIGILSSRLGARARRLERVAAPQGPGYGSRELAGDLARIRRAYPALDDAALRELEAIQHDFLSRHGPRFVARSCAGRVRNAAGEPLAHSDLRLADDDVELPHPVDEDRRGARDVCVDVASLALDLTRAGRGDLAERLIASFAAETNDFELYGVVDYYERCSAVRRAAASTTADAARAWILLGLSTRRPRLLPPVLVAVGGLVASGKSTIARLVAERMVAPRVEADRAREHLVGDDAPRTLGASFEDVVYRELVRRAEIVLASDRPVVLDACFPRRRQREMARRLAVARGWPFLFIECHVAPGVSQARLRERDRRGAQQGWQEIHAALARRWEPIDELPPDQRLSLDCARPLVENEPRIFDRIPSEPVGHCLP